MSLLLQALRHTGRQAETSVEDLNWGGCCVYAAAVARVLVDAGIPAWGIVDSRHAAYDIDSVRSRLDPDWATAEDWYFAGAKSFGHILVRFEYQKRIYTHDSRETTCSDKLVDSWGRKRDICQGRLGVEELERLTVHQSGWNRRFNWGDRTLVRDMVNRYLGAYTAGKRRGRDTYRKRELVSQLQLGL